MNLSFILISLTFFCDTLSSLQADTLQVSSVSVKEQTVGNIQEKPKQKELTHLCFKGIAIDGKLADFGKKLEKTGFRPSASGFYVGSFAGIKNCRVSLFAFDELLWKVNVSFPPEKVWSSVKEQYRKYKDWLGWKYVVSPATVQEHLSPRFKEGTGNEAWGFENGQSVYSSTYAFSDGSIKVYIRFDESSSGMCVCLEYVDRLNSILKEEKDMLDL